MKPITKLHHRVVDLAENLFGISKQQKEWAYRECLEHRAYATKNRVLCLDCGETFSPTLVSRKKAVCPHCNTKVQVKESKCTTDTQTNYFAITDIVEEFQVVRNFEIIAYYKKGRPVDYKLHEILHYWIQPDLTVTMFGLLHTVQGYCDSWGGKMQIREESKYSYYGSKYDVYARKYHPDSKIKPEYKKVGINHNLREITFLEAIKHIPRDPKLETLVKAKHFSLLDLHINKNGKSINYYWPSIKICLRNKYKIPDASIWTDYIDLLIYFNKDIRSAKYVCPKDLNKEHDRFVAKKREHQRKKEIEETKRQIETAQKKYEAEKQKFFDLLFKKGNIVIQPLKTVQEFLEEGDELKHCLFTNKYYDKKDSLILSARVKNKPIETIEISLSNLKIIQARGFKNQSTTYHKKIIEMVNENMHRVGAIINPKKTSKTINKLAS